MARTTPIHVKSTLPVRCTCYTAVTQPQSQWRCQPQEPMSEQPSQDRSSRRSRLARLLPWNWRRGRGDTIQASVGKEAQFVVVGKNVIQIGRVQVPIWLAAVSALAIVAGAGALIYTAVIADSRLGSIEQRVQATDTPAPTPSPTPGGIAGNTRSSARSLSPSRRATSPTTNRRTSLADERRV